MFYQIYTKPVASYVSTKVILARPIVISLKVCMLFYFRDADIIRVKFGFGWDNIY